MIYDTNLMETIKLSLNCFHNTNGWFFYRAAGYLCPRIFAYGFCVTLSKDHTRNTRPTRAEMIRVQDPQNHTLPCGTYRKLPKISPGAYIFQKPFLRVYIRRGLSTEGNLHVKIDWAGLILGRKFTKYWNRLSYDMKNYTDLRDWSVPKMLL